MVFRWETEDRYYCATAYRDLFGTWTVARAWGGRRNDLGGMAVEPVADFEDAIIVIGEIAKRRAQHKYLPVRQC